MPRPDCGLHNPGSTPSATAIVTGVVSGIITVAGIAKTVYSIIQGGLSAVAGYPLLAAIAVGIAITAIVIYFAVERCSKPKGRQSCMAGVIETITPAFKGSTGDAVLKFSSQHDRVDVVVKRIYWDIIDAVSEFVFCSTADQSPMMPSFYFNAAVCNAGIGASVGAGVGAIAGILIAAAVIAAIGCATWILCILALLVAVIIVAVAAILGAIAGGEIGAAATSSSGPTSTGTDLMPAMALSVGDYVSTAGTLVKSGDLDNALVFYFVEKTTLHGHSSSSPSYSHVDPDTNLVPDACPVVER